MISKNKNIPRGTPSAAPQKPAAGAELPRVNPVLASAIPFLASVVYFLLVCLSVSGPVKTVCMILCVAAILVTAVRFRVLKGRITAPFLALALFVLMDGVSTFYAQSGKFALNEFLKVLVGFCLSLILLAAAPGEEKRPGRWIATVLEGCTALMSLVSVDLISTHWISGPFLALIGRFTTDYSSLVMVTGDRIWTMFDNPNVFACIAGLGVLLGLGLAGSSERRGERFAHLALLHCNTLAFVLCVSLGATAFLALAFLALLFLELTERRAGLLVLMVELLALVAIAAVLIAGTSFRPWEGARPLPLACMLLGAAALCLLDEYAGKRLVGILEGKPKLPLILPVAVVGLAAVYAVLALTVTVPVTLPAGGALSRAAYPKAGEYVLTAEADGPVEVTVTSRSTRDIILGSSISLYQGDADGASFTVPEDSRVVYFNFFAPAGARLRSVTYAGEDGSGRVPLNYLLLPDFVVARLQGALANQNSITRNIMAGDGMKLFRRSPVVGLGMGAYESAIKSAQSYYYETKYAHNHYVQVLVETGVIGLALFICLFLVSAAAVWRARKQHPLAPALGAALVFMAGTASREVSFSFFSYIPIAFGVFTLIALCCGGALTRLQPGSMVKAVSAIAFSVLIAVYSVFLGCNMEAKRINAEYVTLASLKRGVELDKFEWADYALGYVTSTASPDVGWLTRQQADEYAARLGKVDSNTIPLYLASYYFETGRPEEALAMVEKSVNYMPSDNAAWGSAFNILEAYAEDTEPFRETVRRMLALMEEWNASNIGTVSLSEEHQAFAAALLAQ